jgi:hypothetical protein
MRGDVSVYKDMLDVNLFETAGIVRSSALEAIASFSSPEIYPVLVQAIEKLTREEFVNVKEARRHIAEKLIEDNSYKF